MFSSGKHEKLNADPEPWLYDGFRATEGIAKSQQKWSTVWREPRPEYDRPLTNAGNGILIRFRLIRSEPNAVLAAPAWVHAIDSHQYDHYPKHMRVHARHVLTRLAALA